MKIKFEGDEADDHEIDAYTGAESLAGIARAAVLVAHYSVTGEVRYRAPYSDMLQFVIQGTRDGSLEFMFGNNTRLAGRAAARARNIANALLGRVLARATGQAGEENLRVNDEVVRSGDIDALAEAATPGLTRAHNWINSNEKRITVDPDNVDPIVLDERTKEYMNTEEVGGRTNRDVSVAALNANSRIGRVYFHDLQRTVPFKVSRNAHPRTISRLSRNLTSYIAKNGDDVNIEYAPVYYPDGRLKKITIFDCDET